MRGDVDAQMSFARGVNTASAPTRFPRDAVRVLTNGRVLPDGSVERRGGTQRSHASALNSGATIYGATMFLPTSGSMQYVVFAGANLYTSTDAATWTQQQTGLTQDYWSFCTMQVGTTAYLYCANGAGVFSWDGTTWASVAEAPSDAKHVATFNDRLYASSGAYVYGSEIGAPTNFTIPEGLALPITTHDGDLTITGLFQAGGVLFVFKRNSTAWIDGYGESTLVVAAGARGLSRSVGCIAHRSIAPVGDSGMIWLSERGFEFYQRGGEITLLTEPIQDYIDTINWDQIETTPGLVTATYSPATQTYYCALPIDDSTTNDEVLVIQPPATNVPPAFAMDDMAVASLFPVADDSGVEQPWGGGYDGFIRELETGNVDDATSAGSGGTDITMTLRAKPMIFGDAFRTKRGRTIAVHGVSSADASLTLKLVADDEVGTGQAVTLASGASGQPAVARKRVSGRGSVLNAQVETTDAVRITGVALIAVRERKVF